MYNICHHSPYYRLYSMPSSLVGLRLRITHDDDVLQNSHGNGSFNCQIMKEDVVVQATKTDITIEAKCYDLLQVVAIHESLSHLSSWPKNPKWCCTTAQALLQINTNATFCCNVKGLCSLNNISRPNKLSIKSVKWGNCHRSLTLPLVVTTCALPTYIVTTYPHT